MKVEGEDDREDGAAAREQSDKGGKRDEALTPVGDGAEGLTPEARGDRDDDRQQRDRDQARDDPDREDERLGRSEHEDDDLDRPRGRRMSRSERTELRNRSKERDRTEIRFLRARNEQLERGATETAKRLDRLESENEESRLKRIKLAIRNADTTITRLTAAGEESQALEAQNLKNNLQEKLEEEQRRVEDAREKRTAGERTEERDTTRRREVEDELSPDAQRNVMDWQRRNRWFNARDPGTDEMVVHALDAQLLRDGMNPDDPEYYRELDRLVEEYLPHRVQRRGRARDDRDDDRDRDRDRGRDRDARGRDRDDDRGRERDDRDRDRGRDRDDDRRDTRGRDRDDDRGKDRRPRGPTFRVGGRERTLRNNEVYLNQDRRKALEDMGAMDDPALQQRYLKAYKKYDDEADARERNDRR